MGWVKLQPPGCPGEARRSDGGRANRATNHGRACLRLTGRRRQRIAPAHQPGGTMDRKGLSLVALASLGAVIACGDHPAVTAPQRPLAAPAAPRAPAVAAPEEIGRASCRERV